MKLLKGLNTKLKGVNGEVNSEDKTDDVYKKYMSLAIATLSNTNPDERVAAWELAVRLHTAEDQEVFEETDYNLIKKAMETTQALTPLVTGQILAWLKTAEEYTPKIEKTDTKSN